MVCARFAPRRHGEPVVRGARRRCLVRFSCTQLSRPRGNATTREAVEDGIPLWSYCVYNEETLGNSFQDISGPQFYLNDSLSPGRPYSSLRPGGASMFRRRRGFTLI